MGLFGPKQGILVPTSIIDNLIENCIATSSNGRIRDWATHQGKE